MCRIFLKMGEQFYPEKALLLFDGSCGLCVRTKSVLAALDIFQRISYVDALAKEKFNDPRAESLSDLDLMRDMHYIVGERVYKGYEAYRAISHRIPLFWIIMPFLYIWPITAIGRKIYRKVADSRVCSIVKRK